jgi:hypothetical protein
MTVTANPAGLAPGYYRSTVTVTSSAGSATLPVTLRVASSATITLGPSATQCQMPAGGVLGNATGSFSVTVTGGPAAAYNALVQPGVPWLAVTSGSGTARAAGPGSVAYSIDPTATASLAVGMYYGTIRINFSDQVNSPQDFLLALNVTAVTQPIAPDLSPAGLLFVLDGRPTAQQVHVFASSAPSIRYQASAATYDGAAWLTVSPSTGTASAGSPGSSSVAINAIGLASGVYRGGVSYACSGRAKRWFCIRPD